MFTSDSCCSHGERKLMKSDLFRENRWRILFAVAAIGFVLFLVAKFFAAFEKAPIEVDVDFRNPEDVPVVVQQDDSMDVPSRMEPVDMVAEVPRGKRSEGLFARAKEPSLATNQSASIMTDAEVLALEEADKMCARMTDFLDDGNHLMALNEARALLLSSNRAVRQVVADALDWIGAPAAMEIATMMDDSDKEIQKQMQEAFWDMLEDVDTPALTGDLLQMALRSKDPSVRKTALDEFLHIPDRLSFVAIAGAMADPDPDVAERARDNAEFISGGEDFETCEDAMAWYEENEENMDIDEIQHPKPIGNWGGW